MALDKSGLQAAIQASFDDVRDGKPTSESAQELADAIDVYVKTAILQVTVPAGTFITTVSGGSGAPAVGVPNPAPIALAGDPDSGTGGLS